MRLYNDPDFVNSIISAINEKKLVLFVGAGFSKLCGLPLWNDLANRLIDKCISDEDIKLNYADRNLITKDKDSKMLITIAYYLHQENGKIDSFNKFMYDSLSNYDNDEETKNRRNSLVQFIAQSGATVLTTNSDDILHECFIDQFIHYTTKDIEKFRMDSQRHLIHLHGYKAEMDSIVFTVKQYLERYANEGFKRTVKSIFNSDSTILFIGYGLNEMQLLDFLVDQSDMQKNRYVLDGFFSYEEADYIAKQHYYSSFDLQLIGFLKDEKNYTALVDALEFLVNEAQDKSRLKPENYLSADLMLTKKPNISVVNGFFNTLMILADSEKKSIIRNIVNSDYMSRWIYYLLKNDKFLFFDIGNCFNRFSDSGDVNTIDLFGYSFVSEVYKKEKSKQIYPFVKKMTLDIIKHHCTLDILSNNEYFGRTILSLVFSERKFINNQNILDFILKKIIGEQIQRDWVSIIVYEPSDIVKSNKRSSLRINKAVIDHFAKDRSNSYEFKMYVSQVGNQLSKLYPNEMFAELENQFRKISKRKYWSYVEIGSLIFAIQNSLNQRDDYDSIILFWYLNSLKNAEPSIIEKAFNQMIKSKNEIELKLAIYLLESKFSILRNTYFSIDFNPFDNWNLYSDLYVLIDNKWDEMVNDEKRLIKSKIEIMRIPMISDFYNQACKLDLIKLIGSKYEELEYHERAILMEQTFSPEESNIYIQLSSPMLRNRRAWSSTNIIRDDEDFKQKLYKMTIDDFIKNLSFEINDYQKHTINSIYKDYFDKNNLIDWITSSSYENLDKVPSKYYHLIFQYLMESSNLTPFNIISFSFNKIIKNAEKDNQNELIQNFFSDMYYSYINKVEREDDFKSIYQFCKELFYKINTPIKVLKDGDKITIQTLLGHDIYQVISLLVRSAYKSKISDVIQIIESKLEDLTETPLIKSIVCANIEFIWMIESEWVKKRIDFLFDNDYNEQNLSILGFTLSQFHHPEFIDFIYQSGLLDIIVNSKDFNENKWIFIHNVLAHIMNYSNKEYILKLIAATTNNFGGIHSYFSGVSKIDDLSKIEESINFICDKLTIFNLKNEQHNAALIVKLLAIYPKLKDSTFLWKFTVSLIPYHGTSYTKKINNQLLGMIIENTRLLEFVELYVSSLDDHFYYLQDIAKLIDIPNWDGQEQKKDILINKIGKVNPEFWKMYNGGKHEQ